MPIKQETCFLTGTKRFFNWQCITPYLGSLKQWAADMIHLELSKVAPHVNIFPGLILPLAMDTHSPQFLPHLQSFGLTDLLLHKLQVKGSTISVATWLTSSKTSKLSLLCHVLQMLGPLLNKEAYIYKDRGQSFIDPNRLSPFNIPRNSRP